MRICAVSDYESLGYNQSRDGYIYADPLAGDSKIAQSYSDYRTVGKLKIPSGRILYNSGGVVQETEFTDVQLNTKAAESVFVGPEGFEKLAAPPATPPAPAVTKLADDVYILEGLAGGTHNTLFVAFNDHILVLEAPEQIIYGNNSVLVPTHNLLVAQSDERIDFRRSSRGNVAGHHCNHRQNYCQHAKRQDICRSNTEQ